MSKQQPVASLESVTQQLMIITSELTEVREALADLAESIKNINLTERDYDVEYE